MPTTDRFFTWYYVGVGGIGGWTLFLTLAIIAIAYIIFDSQWRKVSGAYAWLLGAILLTLLILPTLLYRFAAPETQASLANLKETFFFMGLMGGIVPIVLAIGYTVASVETQPQPNLASKSSTSIPTGSSTSQTGASPPRPPKPVSLSPPARSRLNVWLVNEDTDQNHQLFEGDTRVGRVSSNDIAFPEPSVSREHMLIREDRGHFVIIDRGSKSGTFVNQQKIDGTYQLTHGDLIEIGDLRLRFVTSLG